MQRKRLNFLITTKLRNILDNFPNLVFFPHCYLCCILFIPITVIYAVEIFEEHPSQQFWGFLCLLKSPIIVLSVDCILDTNETHKYWIRIRLNIFCLTHCSLIRLKVELGWQNRAALTNDDLFWPEQENLNTL